MESLDLLTLKRFFILMGRFFSILWEVNERFSWPTWNHFILHIYVGMALNMDCIPGHQYMAWVKKVTHPLFTHDAASSCSNLVFFSYHEQGGRRHLCHTENKLAFNMASYPWRLWSFKLKCSRVISLNKHMDGNTVYTVSGVMSDLLLLSLCCYTL